MGNLLAIDWDFFFRNPLEAGDPSDKEYYLFDWGHRESPFFIEMIWPTRSIGFLKHDLPLPTVNDQWRDFLYRFTFAEDVQSFVSESNMEAGLLTDPSGNPFESVWLFDAHHDSGYSITTLEEFRARQTFSCEDWMLSHALDGAELHVRFPQWKKNWTDEKPSVTDYEFDLGQDYGADFTDIVFDTVHLCRSGAWVPPWEDAKFFEFASMLPGDTEEIGTYELKPREYRHEDAEELLEAQKVAVAAIAEQAEERIAANREEK